MKKIIPIALLFLFASCGSEELLSDSIVGTWQLATLSIDDCPNADNNVGLQNGDNSGCLTVNQVDVCQTIVFNANNTGVNTSIRNGVTESQDFTYTVNNETNIVTSCDGNNNCNSFSIIDKEIQLSLPFGDCTINTTYIP